MENQSPSPEQITLTNESAVAVNLIQGKLNGILTHIAQDAAQCNYQATDRRVSDFAGRLDLAYWYFESKLIQMFHWLFKSGETSNFTYRLTESNKAYLASFCAVITNQSPSVTRGYIDELCCDSKLYSHVRSLIGKAEEMSSPIDPEFDFGRRLGWYALIRAHKPRIVVVETGVAQGIGSLVITSALKRNEKEGCPGYYYGTDINVHAGFLFQGDYTHHGEILYGDSITSLKGLNEKIDLFINDSDHSAEYEMNEYRTVADKLSEHALILGDNAHTTDKLHEFAVMTNRKFLFFQEKPENHWYPGAGIGVAFK